MAGVATTQPDQPADAGDQPATLTAAPVLSDPDLLDRFETIEHSQVLRERAADAATRVSRSDLSSATTRSRVIVTVPRPAAKKLQPEFAQPSPRADPPARRKTRADPPTGPKTRGADVNGRKRAETERSGLSRHRSRPVTPAATGRARTVIDFALAQVGKPYRRNAAGPGAFDCSGLVSVAYRRVGVELPHQSGGIANRGKRVSRADLRPGDIVLPSSGHVGIYLGNGRIVHAATPSKGVVVAKMYGFSTARRLL